MQQADSRKLIADWPAKQQKLNMHEPLNIHEPVNMHERPRTSSCVHRRPESWAGDTGWLWATSLWSQWLNSYSYIID